MKVGAGEFTYEVAVDFFGLPEGFSWREVAAVACDSRDRIYLFNRGDHPMMVFDSEGRFLHCWGEDIFQRAHGLTIGPDDMLYCTDDLDHTVRKCTPEGEVLLTLGHSGQPSDTGATSMDFRGVSHAGPPFHYPTNVALGREGQIYVTDGYGNARVHEFTAEGELRQSWGESGSGPGQFHLPHGIAVDASGRIYVADRENSRIQIFSPDGDYLDQWTDLARPCQVTIYTAGNFLVAELGYRAAMWPGIDPPSQNAPGPRVSIFSPDRQLLARWGGGADPTAPGDFFAPHDVAVNSRGDLFVAEVVWTAGANKGVVSPDCHAIQAFRRR